MTNYTKHVMKELNETTLRCEALQKETVKLRAKNRDLRRQNEMLLSALDEKISQAIDRHTAPLLMEIAHLKAENEKKDIEIQRLKAQINKNSGNSSKPPSSDGFKKLSNSREKSGKKTGGQLGHAGRSLCVPQNLDQLVNEGKADKKFIDHTNGAAEYVTVWTVDVEIMTVYTEHRYPIDRSTEKAANVIYGNNIKALSVLLNNEGLIAERRLGDFIAGISNGLVRPSDSTLESWNRLAANNINMETIRNEILNADVIHVDDTPVKSTQRKDENGGIKTSERTTFNINIRTYSTKNSVMLTVNPTKGDVGVKADGILLPFCWILSHDHDKKFDKYGTLHALCGAHLSRELKGLFESYKISWAEKFRNFYTSMNEYKNASKREECPPDILAGYNNTYDTLLSEGRAELSTMDTGSFGSEELRKMLNRLTDYKDEYMLFIHNYIAPFTNNQAERDLRHCKTKQKISGCFRTYEGAETFAKIKSFILSAKRKGLDLFAQIKALFSAPIVAIAE